MSMGPGTHTYTILIICIYMCVCVHIYIYTDIGGSGLGGALRRHVLGGVLELVHGLELDLVDPRVRELIVAARVADHHLSEVNLPRLQILNSWDLRQLEW